MNQQEKIDLLHIRSLANNLFVHQKVDFSKPNVVAAIVTAGSEMANCAEIATPAETTSVLLDAYESKGIKEVEDLVGSMTPPYTRMAIGYSVDYFDYSRAQVAYEAQKAQYDALYQQIKNQAVKKDQNLGL